MYYYIFGAHSRARTVKEYLRVLEPSMKLSSYLYDNDEANASFEDGVPVVKISEDTIGILDSSCPVYIGTRGVFHQHIISLLKGIGFSDIRPITVELDTKMRNAYVKKVFDEKGLLFQKIEKDCELESCTGSQNQAKDSACIYVAKSSFDKPLSDYYQLSTDEKILQVGAAVSNEHLKDASFFDNDGENISSLNSQFCELTGLFWIWKNATDDIVGLEHYRRHFLLPADWKALFAEKMCDVILPVPLYVAPSLAENYRERHISEIWDNMISVLEEENNIAYRLTSSHKAFEKNSDAGNVSSDFFEQNGLYCPCNMLIARKPIFDRLCSWLFPILFAVHDEVGDVVDAYQNRYPGFLSERLISFWFYEHREEYKIWFADKDFLA